jgi:hypothetical protein
MSAKIHSRTCKRRREIPLLRPTECLPVPLDRLEQHHAERPRGEQDRGAEREGVLALEGALIAADRRQHAEHYGEEPEDDCEVETDAQGSARRQSSRASTSTISTITRIVPAPGK